MLATGKRLVAKQKPSLFTMAALLSAAALLAIWVVVFTHASVATCPNEGAGQCRPYNDLSPWNTEIPNYLNPGSVSVDPNSTTFKNAIKAVGLPLTSNPDVYTIQTYQVTVAPTTANPVVTPTEKVQLTGYANVYNTGDNTRVGLGSNAVVTGVPIDATKVRFSNASTNPDYDSQFVYWDPETGDQWEFWQFRPAQHTNSAAADGNTGEPNYTSDTSIKYMATNYTRYHTKPNTVSGTTYQYYGRANGPGGGRGAGTPYFAGLVRPWEIAQGHIDHALAFAFNEPCCGDHSSLTAGTGVALQDFSIPSTPQNYMRYPAAKSDGGSSAFGVNPPEGTRLQLNFDPNLTDAQVSARYGGLSTAGVVIARALQKYGMYIIDNSGSSKVYAEHNLTANNGAGWGSTITTNTLNGISWDDFRVVATPCNPATSSSCGSTSSDTIAPSIPGAITAGTKTASSIQFSWVASTDNVGVTGYKIYRNGTQVGTSTTNSYTDSGLTASTSYFYTISAYDAAGNTSAQNTALAISTIASSTCTPATNLGNINCDTHIDIFDLSIMLSNYGKTPAQSTYPQADLNGNNLIDIFDLSILLSHFGT